MFCAKCGTEIGSGTRFCAVCGTAVAPVTDDITANTTADVPVMPTVQYAAATPAAAVPISARLAAVPAKVKIAVIAAAVVIIAAVVTLGILGSIAEPENAVKSYADAYMKHNYAALYDFSAVAGDGSAFTSKDFFVTTRNALDEKNKKDDTRAPVSYTVKKDKDGSYSGDSYDEDDLSFYTVKFKYEDGTTDTIPVTLLKNGKRFLFFDRYGVLGAVNTVNKYAVHVPDGAEVTLGGVAVNADNAQLITDDTPSDDADYSDYGNNDDGFVTYVIPSVFEGEYDITVTTPYTEEYTKTISVYPESPYSEAEFAADDLVLNADTEQKLGDTARTLYEKVYTAAVDNAPYSEIQKIIGEDGSIKFDTGGIPVVFEDGFPITENDYKDLVNSLRQGVNGDPKLKLQAIQFETPATDAGKRDVKLPDTAVKFQPLARTADTEQQKIQFSDTMIIPVTFRYTYTLAGYTDRSWYTHYPQYTPKDPVEYVSHCEYNYKDGKFCLSDGDDIDISRNYEGGGTPLVREKVGIIFPDTERYRKDADIIAKSIAGKADAVTEFAKTQPDAAAAVTKLTEAGVSYMIIAPFSRDGSDIPAGFGDYTRTLTEAHDNGIAVVSYNKLLNGVKVDFGITYDTRGTGGEPGDGIDDTSAAWTDELAKNAAATVTAYIDGKTPQSNDSAYNGARNIPTYTAEQGAATNPDDTTTEPDGTAAEPDNTEVTPEETTVPLSATPAGLVQAHTPRRGRTVHAVNHGVEQY